MTALDIITTYTSFFEKKDHKRIANAPLIPENDPTTLFTNSGMQPLIPYLAGEKHPLGKRFVNVQNCFRGQGALDDIHEVGDNRHLTFFRMLGNWSLGDYFKEEQLNWMFEYLTGTLGIDPKKLYVSVFEGYHDIPKDETAIAIWQAIFTKAGLDPDKRIFFYGPQKNWWSRAGTPEQMPEGELGGPDSEIFYEFTSVSHDKKFGEECHINCDCGHFLEISNNVFMEYQKEKNGSFAKLTQQNVDHGAGVERLLMAIENQPDVFVTSLFYPIIQSIEKQTNRSYTDHIREMRMITAHMTSSCFIIHAGVSPSNTEQGYILRKLIRRALDSFTKLGGKDLTPIINAIVEQYTATDPNLVTQFETIKLAILEEAQKYDATQKEAHKYIEKKYTFNKKSGDDMIMTKEISADDAFTVYTTHGLSPSQIKSLGYTFNDQAFAEKMKAHQLLSRQGAKQKFAGGLADHSEKTIMGHTATHLLHQALRDVLGTHVHQTGSNITTERLRFDFNYEQKITENEMKQIEQIINEKILENLPVHFDMMPLAKAKEIGAIGLFDDKYQDQVKVYFIGTYSKEFCGGPHVDFTGKLKKVTILKQENIGNKQRRIYATVGD